MSQNCNGTGTLIYHNKTFSGGYQPISLEKKVLVTLWLLAKGEVLISIGDRCNLAVSTVFYVTNEVIQSLCKLANKYIFWPKRDECETLAEEFLQLREYSGKYKVQHICELKADYDISSSWRQSHWHPPLAR